MRHPFVGLAVIWLLFVMSLLALRPLLPVDETRYLAVAWEMWLRDDFLVPYLNGVPYSHKPPLFFWLIHSGWSIFGVNEWSARLVGPLSALGVLAITRTLAAEIWPSYRQSQKLAPVVLIGSMGFGLYGGLTLFDSLLSLFVVGSWWLLYRLSQNYQFYDWLGLALALAGGLLTKGPVVFVYTLPVALAMPYWYLEQRVSLRLWYCGLFLSLLVALIVALAWAIPAGEAGGESYRQAILWRQTTGRMVNAFDHRLPWWWYAPHGLWLLFPWIYWTSVWHGLRRLSWHDSGVRFCAVIIVSGLLILALLSGKRVHYLLPLLPVMALLIAHGLASATVFPYSRLIGIIAGAGLLLGLISILNKTWSGWPVSPVWGGVIALTAFSARLMAGKWSGFTPHALALMSLGLTWSLFAGYVQAMAPALSVKQPAEKIAQLTKQNRTLAYFGRYHGQFNYYARLSEGLKQAGNVWDYVCEHPEGVLLHAYQKPGEWPEHAVIYRHAYRNKELVLIENQKLRKEPKLLGLVYGRTSPPPSQYDSACQ